MNAKVFNLISDLNETRFKVQRESCEWKCELKKRVMQSKSGIIINVGESVKTSKVWILLKRVICGILVHVIVSVIRHVKLMNI